MRRKDEEWKRGVSQSGVRYPLSAVRYLSILVSWYPNTQLRGTKLKRAVFLDRDSTINEPIYIEAENIIDSPLKPDEFKLLPKSADAIKLLNTLGFFVAVVTNQPAIAKNKTTVELVEQIHNKMKQDLELNGAKLDAIYYCPHSAKGVIPELTIECECRKPGTAMLTKAAQENDLDLKNSYVIGDSWRDIKMGNAAGCTTIMVQHPFESTHADLIVQEECTPDHTAKDLYGAALLIKKIEEGNKS